METDQLPRAGRGPITALTDGFTTLPPTGRAGPWQPILDGELADEARDAVQSIAVWLRDAITSPRFRAQAPSDEAYGSFVRGRSGIALFFAYLEQSGVGPGRDEAATLLSEAVSGASERWSDLSLCTGVSGIGWIAAHLLREGLLPTRDATHIEQFFNELDQRLLETVRDGGSPLDPELYFGLSGYGMYSLERLPARSAVACLEAIIERIAAQSAHHSNGAVWPKAVDTTHPLGRYCTGPAHGIAGPIALLARAYALGIARDAVGPLLKQSVNWLLDRRLPIEADATFPYFVSVGQSGEDMPSRLGWCFGDLSIACMLHGASRAVGVPAWEEAALEVALRGAGRRVAQTGLIDAPFCCGTVGVAHVFHRLYQAFGDPDLGISARLWYARTLNLRRRMPGLTGFGVARSAADGRLKRTTYRGLMVGMAGIGLSLLAAIAPHEPAWDRVLLLDTPSLMLASSVVP